MVESKVLHINDKPRYKNYSVAPKRTFTKNESTGNLAFQEVEVGNMSYEYITRQEFEEHKKHLDSKFEGINNQIDSTEESLKKDIQIAVKDIKEEINKEKITTKRFWLGLSVPAVLSAISIVVGILF